MSAVAQHAEESAPILLREDDRETGVATLTLNRPGALNALSMDLMHAVQAELEALADDRAIKVVVLTGAGRLFSPGHDLKEIRANPGPETNKRLLDTCSRMMMSIQKLPQPVIARVQGPAYAAGCQLVASCDLAVAVDSATFCTPGVNIGLFCSTPMVAISRTIGRKQVMEMLLTGDAIDAETALAWGLVNAVVPAERLDDAVRVMAEKIASKSSYTVSIGKEAFYRQLELPTADAYAYAGQIMLENLAARDAAEGMDAFIEKRSPEWQGR